MAADPRRIAVLAALIVAACSAQAAEPIAPGVRRVCVPAEDGRTWECGTADNPPPQRALAPRESPAPPSFLAAPGAATIVPLEEAPAANAEPIRPRTDDFPAAPERDEDATVAGATPPPASEAPADPDAVATSDGIDEAEPAEAVEPAESEAAANAPVEPAPEAPLEPSTESTTEAVAETPVEQPAETAAQTVEERASEPVVASDTGGEPPSEAPAFLAAPPRRGLSPGPPIDPTSTPEPEAPSAVAAPEPADAVAREDAGDSEQSPSVEPPVEAPAEPLEETVEPAEPIVDASEAAADAAPEPVVESPESTESTESTTQSAVDPMLETADEPVIEDAEPVAETMPEAANEATTEPAAVAESPAAVDATDSAAPSADITPRGREEFLALPGAAYTVQLAHARDASGFPALLASLGLDGSDAYAVPFDRDGARWWMLNWSSFPDAASARAALARLPRGEGVNVGYPRRIALIQNELRK